MTIQLLEAPTSNALSARLDGSLTASASTITLDSISGLVAPGVLVIDRTDGTNDTPAKREYISFTGISGTDLTGVTRGLAGSTAQSHSSGAIVEACPTVSHWGNLVDFLEVEHDSAGKHVLSTVTISYTQTYNLAVSSQASLKEMYISSFNLAGGYISTVTILGLISASGASIVGFGGGVGGLTPFTVLGTVVSGTNVTPYLIVEDSMTLKSVSMVLKSPVSTASLVIDVNKNLVSIFNTGTNPSILNAGTYVSTASLATVALSPGDKLSLDIDNGAGGGGDLTVLLET